MVMSTVRLDALFDRTSWSEEVTIIGGGAVGGYVAEGVIKQLGCGEFNEVHVFDGDVVKDHNLRNQVYDLRHLGMPKVEALRMLARDEWGCDKLHVHNEFVDGYRPMKGTVFLCVDLMSTRQHTMRTCLEGQKSVSRIIEVRMDATHIMYFSLDPNIKRHVGRWHHMWYPDHMTTPPQFGCQGPLSVGPTASGLASMAVWDFIEHTLHRGDEPRPMRRARFQYHPLGFELNEWN